ncbi:MAG TPA: four helix bundle protein [Candidatus Acidoferrales bacterium]|nr:four helix bundle protein [Candidatus Acidoferrales bacterium]
MAQRFEDLAVWQKSRELTNAIYALTTGTEFGRDFGLRDQIRRAAVSVMSNIAEGFERGGDPEFARFLTMAKGSCGEVRCQLYVAHDQGYVTLGAFERAFGDAEEVSGMLQGLMSKVRRDAAAD